MALKNYLIEGVSCTGKTSVCNELQRRGYHAIHGDRELAYQGDPETGIPTAGMTHQHHIWDVSKVNDLIDAKDTELTFFCGGSRNFFKFIDKFDKVFILDIDLATLKQRLDTRFKGEWGYKEAERKLILYLHQTKEDLPKHATIIDATGSIEEIVDVILSHINN